MIYLLLIPFFSTHAFFGMDAGITEGMKKLEGATAASVMIDELVHTTKDGLDYSEVEDLAVEYSTSVAKLRGKSSELAGEAQRIKFIDAYNKRSSNVTKGLKKTTALYSVLCSLSPDSCQVAAQEVGNRKQEETKEEIEKVKIELMKNSLKEEVKRAKQAEDRKKNIKALEDLPSRFFNYLTRVKK